MSARQSLSSSIQSMGRTLCADDFTDLADAELVGRFARDRDEGAFAALVRRHGGLVLGVCQRVLRHHQDAEDAFQATFVILARNAAAVQRANAVGNWLYGVAFNVARKAKAMRQKREMKERAVATRDEVAARVIDDFREILDAELHALSEKYRAAIVLCDVMGLTIQQAADEMRCPSKTMGSRLSRGRALLAARLSRRGVAVSIAVVTMALAPAAMAAALPHRLVSSTVLAATGTPATPAVATLTEGVLQSMSLKTLKLVTLTACGVLLTAGFATHLVQARSPMAPASRISGVADSRPAASRPVRLALPFDHMRHFFAHVLLQVGLAHDIGDGGAVAEDKPVLSGVWTRKEGEMKLDFSEKDTLTITPHGENKVVVLQCECSLGKDGLVKAKVTDISGKEAAVKMIKEKLPIGTEFGFKWTVRKDTATLDDLKNEKIELFKSLMEGEYEKK